MVLLVAECGVNWRTEEEAYKLMDTMKAVGADAVKFQMYREEHIARHPRKKELMDIMFDPDMVRRFKKYGDSIELEVFWTPFYHEAVKVLEEVGVNKYKIRAKDATNTHLLRTVCSTQKRTFISVSNDKVDWDALGDDRYRVELLWCIEKYPAEDVDMHLTSAFPSQRTYISSTEYAGISDHSRGITCPIASASMGAKVIEKHIKLDNSFEWIDDAVSIIPEEFKEMTYHIRRIERLRA